MPYSAQTIKQPRSSEPQPSTASEPQQNTVCDPAPVPVSQSIPAQQAKHPAAIHFGPDPPPTKKRQAHLSSHVVRTLTRLLSSCMGVACHSASLNSSSSSHWCPVFIQVISHLPDKQCATNFSTSAMTSTRPSRSSFSTTTRPSPCSKMAGAQSRMTQSSPHQ